MNEIGKILTEARLSHNIELDQVARETNIAKRYLEALETDNYEVFPGEPYVIGFLRNYCEYLGLDCEEIVNLYKQIKLQESDVPQEALLSKKGVTVPKSTIFILLSVLGAALILILVISTIVKWSPAIKEQQAEAREKQSGSEVIKQRKSAVYELTAPSFEKRLFEGDALSLKEGETVYTLKVKKISPDLIIDTELGDQVIGLGQSLKLDFNDDLSTDMEITLEDIDKNNAEAGALVSVLTGSSVQKEADTAGSSVTTVEDLPAARSGQYRVLFESGSAYPVTLSATFRGYCLFRHESDKANRQEKYYQRGEQLTVQANNGFRIWASNGNMVKLSLIAGGKTVDLEVSRPGEVIVKELKWIKDDGTRRFKFIVVDVD